MGMTQLIREALKLRSTAIGYHVSQQLADRHPDRAILEGSDGTFHPGLRPGRSMSSNRKD